MLQIQVLRIIQHSSNLGLLVSLHSRHFKLIPKPDLYFSGGWAENGSEYQKSYYFPRFFRTSWGEAKGLCSSFGLELATVETRTEAETFLNIVENHQNIKALGKVWIRIDGITLSGKSTTEWFWTKSGNKIPFSLPWSPGQPDCYQSNEYCLSIGKGNANHKFGFNDVPCWNDSSSFICQKVEFMMP